MRLRHLFLLAAALSLTMTGPAWAAQDDEKSEETKKTRRIVRVISTSDDSPRVEVADEDRILIRGEDGAAAHRFLAGFSHRRGYLGIQMVELTPELRQHFGMPEDAGVMISSVVEDSPAAQADLRVGDVLTAIDGESVASSLDIARKISSYDDQSVATLEVWRGGAVRTVTATLVERERPAIDIGRFALPDSGPHHERVWVGPDEIQAHILEIDQGGLQEALREFELRFDNPDFVKKFKVMGEDRIDLEKRIEELEERLRDLERQLDTLPDE